MPDLFAPRVAGAGPSWGAGAAILCACYLLGCLNAGYYLVLWRSGEDIRAEGSGSTGATNTGRMLGRGYFAATLALDMAKGALACGLAIIAGLAGFWLFLALLAVIAGHIWPVQLGFRGGKGVATLMGALLAADWPAAGLIALLFLPFYALLRRFTAGGLAALAAAPVAAGLMGWSRGQALTLAALIMPVMAAHIPNLREEAAAIRHRLKHGSGPKKGERGQS